MFSRKKKEKGKKDSKKDPADVCVLEEVRDPVKEAEMLLMQRYLLSPLNVFYFKSFRNIL